MAQFKLEQYVLDVSDRTNTNRHGLVRYLSNGTLAFHLLDKTTLTLIILLAQTDATFLRFVNYFKEGKHNISTNLATDYVGDGGEYMQDMVYLTLRKNLLLSLFRLTSFLSYLEGWNPPLKNKEMLFNPKKRWIEHAVTLASDYQNLIDEKHASVIADYVLESNFVVNNLLNSSLVANASDSEGEDLPGPQPTNIKAFLTHVWK